MNINNESSYAVILLNRSKKRHLIFLFLLFCISGCVKNAPFRTTLTNDYCYDRSEQCDTSIIEKHLAFDITFIEFTQRGNLYSRENARKVMDYVDQQASRENGAAVFVFAHGWKHNSSANDSNVAQFKDFLSRAAENEVVGKRKVIGVYLGWRGKTSTVPFLKETTYWARKSVAEEIGDGGATEVLSELHQILVNKHSDSDLQQSMYKNTFVVIGHSFGGALVLSALHDVLLHEMISATGGERAEQAIACRKVSRFADGVILLNPAIEANRIILLKEAASRCQFDEQPTLLHVLSSDGDLATNVLFPIVQRSNITSTIGPKKLKRNINDKQIIISEDRLDVVTAGNLKQLRNAYLYLDQKTNKWRFADCRDGLTECKITDKEQQDNHFPSNNNDPLEFIKTDANFIKDHNDVFGCYVQSFITATIFETQSIDRAYIAGNEGKNLPRLKVTGCNHENFNFQACFTSQLDDYDCEISQAGSKVKQILDPLSKIIRD